MPTTVNGVGTHYYGKSNRQGREGVCRTCKRSAYLESYDTRLWFCVVFVPIIPLGRKHIIDQCSRCRRHFVADQDKFEASKQLNTSAARGRYEQQPTPRAALELHASLMAYHDRQQAGEVRRDAIARWPDNAELYVALAEQLVHFDQKDEAAALYRRAWELQPDLPSAKVAVANQAMRAGRPEEARRLLDYLLQRGAGQSASLAPVENLARCYQQAGNHSEALKLLAFLAAELPRVTEDYRFRKMVGVSERVVRPLESILPPRQHPVLGLLNFKSRAYSRKQRFLILGGIAAAFMAIVLVGDNMMIARSRTLHLINEFGTPVQITIDGGPAISASTGLSETTVGEGRHHVAVSGPISEQFDIDISSNYLARWFKRPAWVVDPGSAATLMENTLTYAKAPPPAEQQELAGKPFYALPNIDYAFANPPPTMHVDDVRTRIVKTQLQWMRLDPSTIFSRLSVSSPDLALAFAESWLPTQQENVKLLEGYWTVAESHGAMARAEKFLKAGCANRPVVVNWQRYYQDVMQRSGKQDQLIAEYDAALKADPHNGRLLYLRGRIEPDYDEQSHFFERSAADEPDSPWPWFAAATRAANAGDWQQCKAAIDNATERHLDPIMLVYLRQISGLGLGDFAGLVRQYHDQLVKNPFDVSALLCLCDALIASGQTGDARQLLQAFEQQASALPDPTIPRQLKTLRMAVLYDLGDFDGLKSEMADAAIHTPVGYQADTLLCTGQPDEAAKSVGLQKVWADPWQALQLSVAFSLKDKPDDAAHWRQEAIVKLQHRSPEEARAADCLSADKAPSAEQVAHLQLLLDQKQVLLAALIERFPEAKSELAPLLTKICVFRQPPYQLVHQVLAEAGANTTAGQ